MYQENMDPVLENLPLQPVKKLVLTVMIITHRKNNTKVADLIQSQARLKPSKLKFIKMDQSELHSLYTTIS